MTKRKRVDELRWAWDAGGGRISLAGREMTRRRAIKCRINNETVIRVRVTEVVKKKRKGKR